MLTLINISCSSTVETVVIPPLVVEEKPVAIEKVISNVESVEIVESPQIEEEVVEPEEIIENIEIEVQEIPEEPVEEPEVTYPVYSARLFDYLTLEVVLEPNAMISVPEQMIYFLPLQKDGDVYSDNSYGIRLEGTFPGKVYFSQPGVDKVEIEFEKVSDDSTIYYRREQDPIERDYLISDVSIKFVDGTYITGELTSLDDDRDRTAVILISGSGVQDRNEEIANHRPFLVISDYLTKYGFAVLRCDDRGAGGSTGNINALTTFDFADDVIAEIRFLRELGYKKVCLVGHSEGGVVASIVADVEDVDGIVTMGTPAVSGIDISIDQLGTQFRSLGYDEFQISTWLDIYRNFYESVVLGDFKKARSLMESSFGKATADTMMESVTLPWTMTFLSLDPSIYFGSLECKTLVLQGSLDSQVRKELNEDAMLKALSKAPGTCSYVTFEGKNHLFQNAKTGLVNEYGLISETISPDVLEMIATFISSL